MRTKNVDEIDNRHLQIDFLQPYVISIADIDP